MSSLVINILNSWYISGINLVNNLVKKNTTKATKKRKLSIDEGNYDEENYKIISKKQRFI
jgi:hypothetical protein